MQISNLIFKSFFFALCVQFILGEFAFAQLSPVGQWKTIDDKTHQIKSVVEIYEEAGEIKGKVVKLFRQPEEDQNPKCDKCEGSRQNQPVMGMVILWGLKKESEVEWQGGEVLDPKNGKIYSAKFELIEEGKKLKLRGFLGFSLLGRTQIWERLSETPNK